MTDSADDGEEWNVPYLDDVQGGWPEDDEELPPEDGGEEDWKEPYPDDDFEF